MPPRAARPFVALMAMLAVASLAAPGLAQTKPKKRFIPAPRPAAELVLPPRATSPATAAQSVPLRLGGLVGLTPVGDPAPACRAQCSKDRYVCHAAGDPTDCDGRWIPCLHSCSVR